MSYADYPQSLQNIEHIINSNFIFNLLFLSKIILNVTNAITISIF